MIRLALLSDVHGNAAAFKAVLDDIANRGVDGHIFLGDLVFMGMHPEACVEMLAKLNPFVVVKGNTDANLDEIETFEPKNALEQQILDCAVDCGNRLDEASKSWLAQLPISDTLVIGNRHITFCHGSPHHFNDKLPQEGPLITKLWEEGYRTICCGHTHMPADDSIEGLRMVNPGAIGFSFDGDPRPSYTLLDIGSDVSSQNVRIDYDRSSYLQELDRYKDSPLYCSTMHAVRYGKALPFR